MSHKEKLQLIGKNFLNVANPNRRPFPDLRYLLDRCKRYEAALETIKAHGEPMSMVTATKALE